MSAKTRSALGQAIAQTITVAAGLLPILGLAPATTSAQEVASDAPLMEVVVTGSRIARPEMDAPSPTTVVDAAAIEAGGVTNIVELPRRQYHSQGEL